MKRSTFYCNEVTFSANLSTFTSLLSPPTRRVTSNITAAPEIQCKYKNITVSQLNTHYRIVSYGNDSAKR